MIDVNNKFVNIYQDSQLYLTCSLQYLVGVFFIEFFSENSLQSASEFFDPSESLFKSSLWFEAEN